MTTRSKHILHSAFLGLCVLALSTFAPAGQAEPGEGKPVVRVTQVDTSQFPLVTVYVSITNEIGEPVEVTASRLTVEENGVSIKPETIQGVGEVGPLATLLVMDISGSMNSSGKLQAAKAAARAFVEQTRPNDQTGLLAFNTEVSLVQPLTQDRQALIEAIGRLRALEDTAMYDALLEAVSILGPVAGRKAIIVLTDGMDNRSTATPEQVLQRIGPAGLSISTIGLGDPEHSQGTVEGLDEAALVDLANRAGGAYGYANDAASLRQLYERYGRALQSEYVIHYTSPSQLRDGVNRNLHIALANPVGQPLSGSGEATIYNPGGLVPEVASPAPWGSFLAVLAALILLLLAPFMIGKAALLLKAGSGKPSPAQKTTRIKLK